MDYQNRGALSALSACPALLTSFVHSVSATLDHSVEEPSRLWPIGTESRANADFRACHSGSKFGGGGVAGENESSVDRRERLRKLAVSSLWACAESENVADTASNSWKQSI